MAAWLALGEVATPVVHSHFIRLEIGKDYLFTGDYSQTIRDTARADHLPLIDLETASMVFANKLGNPGWKDYWLTADPVRYPFYADGIRGSLQQPDPTHFQKQGAEAMAGLVAQEISKNPSLKALASKLD